MRLIIFFVFFVTSPLFCCPFCPGSPQKEAQTFYEDELVFGFYPHKPLYENHVLVIPQRHVERLEDLSDEEMTALFHLIQKIHEKVFLPLGLTNYFILQKNGKSAGQSVPHAHIHMIPVEENTGSLSTLWRFLIDPLCYPKDALYLAEKTAFIAEKLHSTK